MFPKVSFLILQMYKRYICKNNLMNHSLYFLLILLTFSCGIKQEEKEKTIIPIYKDAPAISIKYAQGFKIIDENHIRKVQILNPFKNYQIENTFVLLNSEQLYSPRKNEEIIRTPVQSIAALSTAFYAMITELGQLESIVAIENSNITFSPSILSRAATGEIDQVGGDSQLNIEKLILLSPEIVMVGGYGNDLAPSYQKLKDAGISIIQNYDWKEETPLARAEWIKLFGALYDENEKADSIFSQIKKNYEDYAAKTDTITNSPKALFSSMYNGTWYMPGGKSYVAHLLKDAKGTYPWEKDSTSGSIPLSMEAVANKMLDADIWIASNHYSLQNVINDDRRYAKFAPYINKSIFEPDRRTTKQGGNDFWETGALRVDLIIRDYINMLHPGVLDQNELYFFRKLE